MTNKIAFVVQRFGEGVLGGAESFTKETVEQLAKKLSWQIDVLTSTAKDYTTWESHFPAGEEEFGNIRILRFKPWFKRAPYFGLFNRLCVKILACLRKISVLNGLVKGIENLWLMLQGPVVPGLCTYLKKNLHQYQKVFFVTYLYYPTVRGTAIAGDKAVLIPTAHDEPAFHFLIMQEMLRRAPHILSLNPAEAKLIRTKLPVNQHQKVQHVGKGFDDSLYQPLPEPFFPKEPRALYLGRISAGKGVDLLLTWMPQYFPSHELVLVGHKDSSFQIPDRPNFNYVGFVSEGQKVALMQKTTLVMNPSRHESLSMIVIEAIALKKPVLVNGASEVLAYYVEHCPTVYSFTDETSFKEQLEFIFAQDWASEANQMKLEQSRKWLLDNYKWDAVIKVYQGLLNP